MLFEEWFRLISAFTDGTGRPESTQEALGFSQIAHNSRGLVRDTFVYNPVILQPLFYTGSKKRKITQAVLIIVRK